MYDLIDLLKKRERVTTRLSSYFDYDRLVVSEDVAIVRWSLRNRYSYFPQMVALPYGKNMHLRMNAFAKWTKVIPLTDCSANESRVSCSLQRTARQASGVRTHFDHFKKTEAMEEFALLESLYSDLNGSVIHDQLPMF